MAFKIVKAPKGYKPGDITKQYENSMKTQKYVSVPVEWFDGLNELLLGFCAEIINGKKVGKRDSLNLLIGYCSSAKTIIKNFKQHE